jgi:lysophospholipase L1-like esterase
MGYDIPRGGTGGSDVAPAPPVSARYWRIRSQIQSVGLNFGLSCLKFLDINGANLVGSGTPLASGTLGPWTVEGGFDPDTTGDNAWYSGAEYGWLGYDFGHDVTVMSFSIAPMEAYAAALGDRNYIDYSDDGATWTPVTYVRMRPGTPHAFETYNVQEPIATKAAADAATAAIEAGGTPWLGKGFAFRGDSIAQGYLSDVRWGDLTCDALGAVLLWTHAVGGMKMGDVVYAMSSERLADVDLLLIELGTNDYANDVPIGSVGDIPGSGTFCGDVAYNISQAYTAKPGVTLGFITPFYRSFTTGPNGVGKTLLDYVDAIKAVCASQGVPVLDLFRNGQINAYNHEVYLADGLHANTAGHHLISRMATAFAKSM